MIHFFGDSQSVVYALATDLTLDAPTVEKLSWLFGNLPKLDTASVDAFFIGPRAAMVTPWSTNATEITQNMGIVGITRIECFRSCEASDTSYDQMLFEKYPSLGQDLFHVDHQPEPVQEIRDIAAYNQKEGLALSTEEVDYLVGLSDRLGRPLTDSEVFGFSQVNSEHCRHKIFNGTFIVDGVEKEDSLFKLIRKTSATHPNEIVSAYKDNVAFIKGPQAVQFAPGRADQPDWYQEKPFTSVLSLKAETHNFPTTVEPFNGAATGSGGEIRDRLAGGKGSIPLAGTAVYMTAYSRLEPGRSWENKVPERKWLYQTPMDILIKASNGASDFGNKFGQPLISGSVLTFEHQEHAQVTGYDKVIMLAGGIGYGKAELALKDTPRKGDHIVVMGGDNYRIGMGGAAVSSTDTGAFSSAIELNAVQRSNPEMQKRVANAIRGLVESDGNPIVSIHDHGAGGHLNCLSELVEETGGNIHLDRLPVGDPTLSAKEIIGNESQERMGLVIAEKDIQWLQRVAERERAPMYDVGEVTGDHRFVFASDTETPMDLELSDLFGSSPRTILRDKSLHREFAEMEYDKEQLHHYLEQVLQLEAVACKDWLTNKVDRCVGGRVAKQQCAGPLQLPLNNCGVMALDFKGKEGLATSIGHSPVSALIDPVAGSRNSIAEALTNLVWAPLEDGLKSVSLSANWMWPCNNVGEYARLYRAVEAASDFAIALGINIPTGKDSLSMKQRYPEGDVLAPGTVIISTGARCNAIQNVVEPVFKISGGPLYYLNLSSDTFELGGSSLGQVLGKIGTQAPTIKDPELFATAFDLLQQAIKDGQVVAGHDVASGGLITTLLEGCFSTPNLGAEIDLTALGEADLIKVLFAENAGVVFQGTNSAVEKLFSDAGIEIHRIGEVREGAEMLLKNKATSLVLDIPSLRDTWYKTSYLLDAQQTSGDLALTRYKNYGQQPLRFDFPKGFSGKLPQNPTGNKERPKAAILREKGSNSEREMAHAMYLAGFDVKDVHMTDLISGRETLEGIRFIGAVGGFSNSDVLGSAKGWAGAFKYNDKANKALQRFFARHDTLSIGICNGCQLFMELDLIHPDHEDHGKMTYNDSYKHESAFTSVRIEENHAIMLKGLAGTTLGVWISHGEGKFRLPYDASRYNIVGTYGYASYPSNPNGSDYNTAMLCDDSGRHLVTMPHIERSIFPWNWAYYQDGRQDEVSPWLQAFVNAREWIESHD